MKYSIFFVFFSYITMPKFCVNCVHFATHERLGDKFGYCNMFPTKEFEDKFLVTGEIEIKPLDHHYCSTARNLNHMCGERARHFFPKMDEIKW